MEVVISSSSLRSPSVSAMEVLRSVDELVTTSSRKLRLKIFRGDILSALNGLEISVDLASYLVGIIFKTLFIYDDRDSRKAVDEVIVKALNKMNFTENFAETLVETMQKQLKFDSRVGCLKLLKWSCLLSSQYLCTDELEEKFWKNVSSQASLLHKTFRGSFRIQRACKQMFFHLFSQTPNLYEVYAKGLRDSRIRWKNSAELILLMLDFSTNGTTPCQFEQYKEIFLEIYVKAVLSAIDKPPMELNEAFHPLFLHMSHEDFRTVVVPAFVKMLKRDPGVVLESFGVLLRSVNLDLSKYSLEILSVVSPHARHAEEERRQMALVIVRCLSKESCDPDSLQGMFNAVKSIMEGSEGRLAFPYQRAGMIDALQELSNAPKGKSLNNLAPTISRFLQLCYKDDGNEEVKLAILRALASWASRSAESVQPNVVSLISTGLKEKEALRRAHLRCLRVFTKDADVCVQLSSLVGPLVQLVKTGYTKEAQRLDGIYALLSVAKIATIDFRAEETLKEEKIWPLIFQNEPSVISISMASKLSVDDCMACVDLLEVLLVDHVYRVLETFPVRRLFQLILYLICHPSWDIRRAACNALKKIITASPKLSDNLLLEFTNYLSVLEDKFRLCRTRDAENLLDAQVPFLPSKEILVKALLTISSLALAANRRACTRLAFCSHHPCFVSGANKNAVWRRLQKSLRRHRFDVFSIITAELGNMCKDLLGPMGLNSPNPLEQSAAINSLSALMSIVPKDTYVEVEEYITKLPDLLLHDALSENEIQIFRTPEGVLSSEQDIYVAKSPAVRNTKQAKGRFRAYDDQDDLNNGMPNHSVQREPSRRDATSVGKKDIGKGTKRSDKGETAKEEVRELLLQEEAVTREKVRGIEKNLNLMLQAIGELAISNPVFSHSQLPSLLNFVAPLLRSAIVSDMAFETMLKLARCLAPPLCNWAPEIAAALRIISTEERPVVWELACLTVKEEPPGMPSISLFERIISGLLSCNSGSLPADSFIFIFPILEKILLSAKETKLHDPVLVILYLHLDPILPLPRLAMLSVLYHVLGVLPSYEALVTPMLNELCLGLQPNELAPALNGVYAKNIHVRLACLNAVKCAPSVSGRSLPQGIQIATSIWIALHDSEKSVAKAAEDIWERYGYDFGVDYSGLLTALSHINYNVRLAAAKAISAALNKNPDTVQETLSNLFSLYIHDVSGGGAIADSRRLGRQGIALALQSAADVLRAKDLPVVMTFLISCALADPNTDVRGRMIKAGIMIIDKHGKDNVSLLSPIFENYLRKKASDEEKYNLLRKGAVIFMGELAKYLAKDDPKVHTVVEKLLDVLSTPSEAVQRAVLIRSSPLMNSKKEMSFFEDELLLKVRVTAGVSKWDGMAVEGHLYDEVQENISEPCTIFNVKIGSYFSMKEFKKSPGDDRLVVHDIGKSKEAGYFAAVTERFSDRLDEWMDQSPVIAGTLDRVAFIDPLRSIIASCISTYELFGDFKFKEDQVFGRKIVRRGKEEQNFKIVFIQKTPKASGRREDCIKCMGCLSAILENWLKRDSGSIARKWLLRGEKPLEILYDLKMLIWIMKGLWLMKFPQEKNALRILLKSPLLLYGHEKARAFEFVLRTHWWMFRIRSNIVGHVLKAFHHIGFLDVGEKTPWFREEAVGPEILACFNAPKYKLDNYMLNMLAGFRNLAVHFKEHVNVNKMSIQSYYDELESMRPGIWAVVHFVAVRLCPEKMIDI